ncbi:TPA: DUF2857 domain-containing protein [Citrobacter freundii]|uniref:DUF2857 domain-containing protein n=1 Tax=Klebsiella oxytoca TaxID=571 RepID=UPI00115A44E4|nr:DUF2857 domain-containing protein [Klebsiella oxytoca]EKU2182074.1 DUF2857 domain-containing protein [Citrobacter freundii]EKV4364371.1 DUF2857 domain-containing protein [Citrobacter freundii]MBZ7658834.1 DUF2857 domain-containing protein [Klebsiella oxytoca]HDT6516666.1 DUF2857 domain-containing protein [Citrobacter freundii]
MLPSLNYVILTQTLLALKEGNFRHCEALGFTLDELILISKLTFDELVTISQASTSLVNITIRHEVLHQILERAHREFVHQQQINRAIRLGGSISLMNRYFGLTSNDVSARRRLLGVKIPNGRPPIPDEKTDAIIWQQWQALHVENPDSPHAFEAMMQITESLSPQVTRPSLTAVWHRINLCKHEMADRRAHHAG